MISRNAVSNHFVWHGRENRLWVFDLLIVVTAVILVILGQHTSSRRIGEFRPSWQIVAAEHRLFQQTFNAPHNAPATAATVVRGTLENRRNSPSGLVRVVAHFLDNRGQPLRKAIGYPTIRSIPAHGTAEFIVVTYADSRIADYRLSIEEERSRIGDPSS